MTSEEFLQLLRQPAPLTDGQADALRELTRNHPYFASAWALYAKHLHDTSDLRYSTVLAQAALLTTDRSRLKQFVESTVQPGTETYTLPETEGGGAPLQHQDLIDAFLGQAQQPHRALPEEDKPERLTYQPVETQSANDSVLTETLANIYIRQKRYEKAIGIFEKLNLKYPEKSTYFASRIKEIEELIKNNA
ncbi:MAG: hypothetical protein J6Z12_02775 [Paludibacteraceae bacterium]|nr:hypothetical protein [Paludibacteraceae bacterium]